MIDNENLKKIKKYCIEHMKEFEKNRKYNPNLELQSALLLMDLIDLMEKLPDKCRVYNLKQFIFNVELNLQHIERYNKCCNCDWENEK